MIVWMNVSLTTQEPHTTLNFSSMSQLQWATDQDQVSESGSTQSPRCAPRLEKGKTQSFRMWWLLLRMAGVMGLHSEADHSLLLLHCGLQRNMAASWGGWVMNLTPGSTKGSPREGLAQEEASRKSPEDGSLSSGVQRRQKAGSEKPIQYALLSETQPRHKGAHTHFHNDWTTPEIFTSHRHTFA